MRWLLDVNALLALGFEGHIFHDRMEAWVCDLESDGIPVVATCPITELGFVRILLQLSRFVIDVASAKQLLANLRADTRVRFEFLSDNHGVDQLPDWVKAPKDTTDGHLLGLAQAHGWLLATLDEDIPGAFLIPEKTSEDENS